MKDSWSIQFNNSNKRMVTCNQPEYLSNFHRLHGNQCVQKTFNDDEYIITYIFHVYILSLNFYACML